MAVTSIWPIKQRLEKVLNYATNPEKTSQHVKHDALGNVLTYATREEKVQYVTGINCQPETARQEMELTKRVWHNEGGRVGYHGYQSFAPGETTPETAHAIGVEFARRMWGDRFEVVVATHIDREHLHNHFVVNSVSFVDGKKFYNRKKDYWGRARVLSDEVCREFGLSVIEHTQGKGRHYKEVMDEKAGKPTLRNLVRADVHEAIEKSLSFQSFIEYLEHKGYSVKYGPRVMHIAVAPAGSGNYMRLYKLLGPEYEEAGIRAMLDGSIPIPAMPGPRADGGEAAAPAQEKLAKQNRHPRRFRLPQEHRRHKGIVATYYKYLYLLGKVGKRKVPGRAAFALRLDLKRFEQYKRQFRFLYDNKIETDTQLSWFADALQADIDSLVAQRKPLYRAQKRAPEQERPQLPAQIADITKNLQERRRALKLCVQIEQDISYVRNQTEQAEHSLQRRPEERERKEKTQQPRNIM